MELDCGPIADRALCLKAAEVAATAKVNPPQIVAVRIRLPDEDDACRDWLHPCFSGAVIVEIQSGDAIEAIPLIPSADGWVRLDLVR
ncbi:MAG: hypothetical protein AB1736_05230 [Chloroflexota bacterium]